MADDPPPPSLPWPACLADPAFRARVAASRVLCVGAGGIGCELLKTLVLSGFRDIDVDLDTIDVSNLNRQFLFRRAHVGASKASVAAASASRFAPHTHITPHRADVRSSPSFTPVALASYTLIVNGLDNLDARRHVNRCALAARVPLVESGSAGVLGQVTVHARGLALGGEGDDTADATECYECAPKAPPKTFPVCTIRNTPDKPIHAVVWAKELLYARLLGPVDAVTDLDDGGGEGGGEGGEGEAAAAAAAFLRADGEDTLTYAQRVFDRVFGEDVERTRAMDDLWTKRPRPTPYRLADLLPDRGASVAAAAASDAATATRGVARSHAATADDHTPWPPPAAAAVFVGALAAFHTHRPADVGAATFDKDDRLSAELVAAATALRCSGHAIPTPSFFDARGAAGNIVHAVATTNAIVAGLVSMEALKLVARVAASSLRATFLFAAPSAGRLLTAGPPLPPAPGCAVCGTAGVRVSLDCRMVTLGELVDKVIKARLAMVEPTLAAPGGFLYEEGDDLDADEIASYSALRPLALASLPGGGLHDGTVMTVTDNAQAVTVAVTLAHVSPWDADARPDGFVLEGQAPTAEAGKDEEKEDAGAASSSGFEVVEEEEGGEEGSSAPGVAPAEAAAPPVAAEVEEEAPPPAATGRVTRASSRKRKAAGGEEGGGKRR